MNPIGAIPTGDGGCRFRVWAPGRRTVDVRIIGEGGRVAPMNPEGRGYWSCEVPDVPAGALYDYRLDGDLTRPDPASRHQPRGVHGPSCVVDPDFAWSDGAYRAPALRDYIVYELHVGTFTREGTFDAAAGRLAELSELGITAVELMPVAQFPGTRNWGYDAVYPFAAQHSYGGPDGLRRFVDACHARGIALILDVVYNHLGPEGNYLAAFGPYFTEVYNTPWGPAVNFDGADSDEVREYFVQNALYWMDDCHVDALRLDAVHAILDRSPDPFLAELARRCRGRGYLIPESDANDRRLVTAPEGGGYGLDAQWNDDFHHALHALVTGESDGYYADYGSMDHLEKAYRQGFVYTGEYSRYRRRRHGSHSRGIDGDRFVVFAQNHDQVGNRARGERLSALVGREMQKLVAGAVLLSPYIPLLFMGEEYGEKAPFLYFTSHTDPELGRAVSRGRRAEFAAFGWTGDLSDPQAERTFEDSRLTRDGDSPLRDFYRALIALRRSTPALSLPTKEGLRVSRTGDALLLAHGAATVILNFGDGVAPVPLAAGVWEVRLDSADRRWGGPGTLHEAAIESNGETPVNVSPTSVTLMVCQRR